MESNNKISNETTDIRMVSKKFKCPNCNETFKKLVNITVEYQNCPKCNNECPEVKNDEFHRDNTNTAYRINFSAMNEEDKRKYHSITDTRDKTAGNIHADNNRNQRPNFQMNLNNNNNNNQRPNQQPNNILFQGFFGFGMPQNPNENPNTSANNPNEQRRQPQIPFNPFSSIINFNPFMSSPFSSSVNRHFFDFGLFDGPIASEDFILPSEAFFLDNFASNFMSNFNNPMERIIFINTMNNPNQHQGNPPASKKSLEKLKKFKMEEKFAKKDKENKLEYPDCSICLMQIAVGQLTVLLPCGHMFHDECAEKWLQIHNTCPLCRFELPTDDQNYERERIQRENQREENMRNNPGVRRADYQNPQNMNQSNININAEGGDLI